MKYNPAIWFLMTRLMKKPLKNCWPDTDALLKKAQPIYQDLLAKVEGVSDNNPMSKNITMSFVIIAVWLASDREITPDQMSKIVEKMLDIPLMKRGAAAMIDMNTEKGIRSFEKMIRKSADWAKQHTEDWNTWDFHFDNSLHKDGFYYHFTHCPIASFCEKYGYQEINPILCNIDYITMGMMHSKLIREHTVAEGAGICDYWTVGNQITNPQ